MNILVLGGGRVGFGVAKELSLEENNVSVVDSSKDVLNLVSEKLDVKPVLGHAADISVLKKAGIESADIVIAVTASDEVNITACQIADFMFNVGIKIARIGKKAYFPEQNLFRRGGFPIDFVVSPAFEVVKMVKRVISIPGTVDVISCVNNKLRIIGIICKKGSPIADIQLKYIQSVDKFSSVAILFIKRGIEWVIPSKNEIIRNGDEVYFVCSSKNVTYAMSLFGYSSEDEPNIIFIGGNDVCEEVVSSISDQSATIKVIESDLSRAEELSEKLNNAEVLHGDPLNSDVLEAADMGNSGIVISVTNDDKINILSCLLAKKLGAKRVAAILNDSSYSEILYSLGINSILDSRMASVSKVLHHIHKGRVEDILSFDEAKIEVIALEVFDNSHAVGILVEDILIKNEVYIPAILRGDEVFILPQKMLINAGDKVLFLIHRNAMDRVLKLFQEKPKYLL